MLIMVLIPIYDSILISSLSNPNVVCVVDLSRDRDVFHDWQKGILHSSIIYINDHSMVILFHPHQQSTSGQTPCIEHPFIQMTRLTLNIAIQWKQNFPCGMGHDVLAGQLSCVELHSEHITAIV